MTTNLVTAAPVAIPVADRHRYPGVRPFEESDCTRFFGRTRATEELLLRVLSVRLLLQFAPSGAGKTSLLHAGLFPLLRPHAYFPFTIRLNDENESLTAATARSLRAAARSVGLEAPVIPEDAGTLWALLNGTQLWSADLLLLTPVLVFDQFEEVFTLRSDSFRRSLAHELGELSRGRPPDSSDAADRDAPDAKIIISLREEYLGQLEEMSAAIPDLFKERLRLSPLTHDEAREAIVEPARLGGDWSSPRFEFAPDGLDGMIDFIDGVSNRVRVVESLTLQLVCQRAEAIATARPADSRGLPLTLADFGGAAGLERLVHQYYKTELDRLGTRAVRRRVEAMFEQGLLDQSGKRLMLEQGEIERDYKVTGAHLDQLVESRLVRREPRNESIFYEISHDRLTEVIARHRSPHLPGWVWPALAIAVLFILVLGVAFIQTQRERRRAVEAQQKTASALQVLLGDALGLRLREAGMSDALRDVLDRAPIDRASGPLATSLHLRRLGELAWERDPLERAAAYFTEALGLLDGAIAAGRRDAAIDAERAQVLRGLGDVAREKGEVAGAMRHYTEAVKTWDGIAAGSKPDDLLSAVEARLALGAIHERTGDPAGAENEYAAAGRQALGVLREAYERLAVEPTDRFGLGRAMQVYADAALGLARVWWNLEELSGARALAAGLIRMRPLSAQARVQLGTASAVLAIASVTGPQPEAAAPLFVESGAQFRELTQLDPRNLRMRRESAAVQLLTSEGIADCAERSACLPLLREGETERAEAAALDSIGTFRELADKDQANTSLLDDVAWGLETHAKLIRARLGIRRNLSAAARAQLTATAMRQVNDAVALRRKVIIDPVDLQPRASLIKLLVVKANVLVDADKSSEALQTLDESLGLIEQLPPSAVTTGYRAEALRAKANVLTAMGREDQAKPLRERAQAHLNDMGQPWDARRKRALASNAEGNTIYGRALGLSGGVAAAQFELASQRYLDAIGVYPFHAIFWDNLRGACAGAAIALASDSKANPLGKQHETALRCALTGAWMAWILSDVPPGVTGEVEAVARRKRLRTLYEDRRSLALHLRDDRSRVAEALALTEQGVKEAEEHAQQDAKSTDAAFLVADAYYGLAMLREEAGLDGWEPAFRSAIVHGERVREREPDAERHTWLGAVHAEFANRLEKAPRPAAEAAEERAHGLRICQTALRLAKNADEREKAEGCIAAARP